MLRKPLRALAGLACALPLVGAAPAMADSVVFVKDANLWVANPDGSAARAVTSDGTAASPYRSPPQADDGTIAVSYEETVRIMDRDGTLVRTLDPPPLTDSVSHPVDGVPVDVAISPDAKTIAYVFASYSCPVGADCSGRETMGYMPVAGGGAPSQYSAPIYLANPSWASNSRTLAFGGFGHQVNRHDLGAGSTDVHWFDDHELDYDHDGTADGMESSTDLDDGELNRQGDRIALIRGYGSGTHMVWATVSGSGMPAPVCVTGDLAGMHGPTWAPDGTGLAWGEPDGIWMLDRTTAVESECSSLKPRLAIPGGSEPDWGPAGIGAPKPAGQTQQTGAPAGGSAATLRVSAPRRLRMKALAKGFSVTVTAPGAGTATVRLLAGKRLVAFGKVAAKTAGTLKVRLKPTKAGRRLARKRQASVVARLSFAPAGGGAATKASAKLKLRR
jgi:hypothetical protein